MLDQNALKGILSENGQQDTKDLDKKIFFLKKTNN